jgi:diguanylate cyclase (GGDEF)-like protein
VRIVVNPSNRASAVNANQIDSQVDSQIDKIQRDQRLRIKRLGMSFASYMVTFMIVSACVALELLKWREAMAFLGLAVLVNAIFFVLFRSGLNLRFRDPSLTAAQMLVSILPALYVMFFLESGQARAAFIVVAIVPILFGMLSLRTRQFMIVGALIVALYGVLLAALALWRPVVLNVPLEILQAVALALVIAEMSLIGGYISGLRSKLRQTNRELKEALVIISDMANRDVLTGLYNRRHLFDLLACEINRERRTSGPFSVCILDVDHFKRVNDQYGHQVGDMVLKRIAGEVSVTLRNIDCIGRYGGEEFLMVLPQTLLDGAMVKAERVRQLIAAIEFPEIGPGFQVTVSIGVAQFNSAYGIDKTISRADLALYRAKSSGRNCCVSEKEVVVADTGDVMPVDKTVLSGGSAN